MKANLTRSPWRTRPSLFLGFRAPSAAADSHAVTAPVLPVRRSSTLRLDLAQHRSRPAVPSAARRARPAPVPAQSRRSSCPCRPPAAPPRPCTQPKTSAACPARVSPSSTPNCTFVLLGVSTQPGQVQAGAHGSGALGTTASKLHHRVPRRDGAGFDPRRASALARGSRPLAGELHQGSRLPPAAPARRASKDRADGGGARGGHKRRAYRRSAEVGTRRHRARVANQGFPLWLGL